MLVIDILYVDPFDFEISFELQCMIFPPKRESFFVICRFESCNSFEHSTLYGAKEQIGISIIINFSLPKLFDLTFIFWSSGPNTILNGLCEKRYTLWTLSSLALRITMPVMFCYDYTVWCVLTCLRWGNPSTKLSQFPQFFA